MSLHIDPRFKFAAERTMLAWIRTGLALMGFGFVVAEFGPGRVPDLKGAPVIIGCLMTLLGVLVILASDITHKKTLKKLEAGESVVKTNLLLGTVLSWTLALVGVVMVVFLYLL